MLRRIRVPRCFYPRTLAELEELGPRLGGKVTLIEEDRPSNEDGKARRYDLGNVMLEFDDEAPENRYPPPSSRPQPDLTEAERKAIRAIAQLAAHAWAEAAKQPLPANADSKTAKP